MLFWNISQNMHSLAYLKDEKAPNLVTMHGNYFLFLSPGVDSANQFLFGQNLKDETLFYKRLILFIVVALLKLTSQSGPIGVVRWYRLCLQSYGS
jgi:hypothetical protein